MKRRELAQHSAGLGFTPQDAVRWLSPASLGRTALKVMVATVFADFGDKRELEAGLPGEPLSLDALPVPGQPAQPVVSGKGLPRPDELGKPRGAAAADRELWLDFTADLGDGFDATYTVALLLGQEQLNVAGLTLPCADILVLGGDEVYPVASPDRYEDRMVGPYRKAFPAMNVAGSRRSPGSPDLSAAASPPRPGTSCPPARVLFALPGNHDWYDGLTSFIRVFTRQRSIGGWRTIQTRSYFAVRLSGGKPGQPGWWLLGLDSQLGQYIDEPQLEYFYRNVTTQLQEGDAIILCVASPHWVFSESPSSAAFRQVNFFEQDYLRRRYNPETGLFEQTGAAVRLWLSGDLHHYSRFEQRFPGESDRSPDDAAGPAAGLPAGLPADPRRTQLITCGLGGAYAADTHWLPRTITLPPLVNSPSASAALPETHAAQATADADPVAGRPFRRMPTIYPGSDEGRQLAWQLANPLSPYWLPRRNPGFGPILGVVHAVVFLTLWTVYSAFRGQSLPATLDSVIKEGILSQVALAVLAPLVLLAVVILASEWLGWSRRGSVVWLRGALFQVAALGVGTAVVLLLQLPVGWPRGLGVTVALVVIFLSGWTVGSEAFALFILGTKDGEVASWKMSGQAIEDHKGFLRLHLAPDGNLTVYPVAADSVCHDWVLEETADGVRPVPREGLPGTRLLEAPITISREEGTP